MEKIFVSCKVLNVCLSHTVWQLANSTLLFISNGVSYSLPSRSFIQWILEVSLHSWGAQLTREGWVLLVQSAVLTGPPCRLTNPHPQNTHTHTPHPYPAIISQKALAPLNTNCLLAAMSQYFGLALLSTCICLLHDNWCKWAGQIIDTVQVNDLFYLSLSSPDVHYFIGLYESL